MASFSDHDFAYLTEAVAEAAREEIVPRFRTLDEGDIDEKTSAIDLVTQADILSEKRITAALKDRFPHALVVGEEAYESDKSVVGRLRDAELAFVIDPVDGTFNFAAGSPLFATIVAVVEKGETTGGLIYDSLNRDRLTAMRGAGAYLRRQDGSERRIKTAAPVPLDQMVGSLAWPYMEGSLRSETAARMAKIKMNFSINCSAYEYWMAATGRWHFTGHALSKPWDHLAGVLIYGEAGGITAKFNGEPYLPGNSSGGILSAPDKETWELLKQELLAL